MPTAVEVLPDDCRWYLARLLGQHRDRGTGDWRCGVRYSVGARDACQRVLCADQCRVPLPIHGPSNWRRAGRDLAVGFAPLSVCIDSTSR